MTAVLGLLGAMTGGALGALGRHGIAELFARRNADRAERRLPWGTFVANVLGCFVVGALVLTVAGAGAGLVVLQTLLITGVCGAFTTMSAFAVEVVQLLRRGFLVDAVGYVMFTAGGCMVAFYLGLSLATLWLP